MSNRLTVAKTYKLYIGGKFPRSESGRAYAVKNAKGENICQLSRASRKDFREAVVACRKAIPGWASRTAFNRSQILYRIAEMLESRKEQFIYELQQSGSSKAEANKEIEYSIDRLVYYAGWADKYTQVFGSVNPVATSHFNFSMPEPMGIIAAMAPEKYPLLGLISVIAPIITGGNSCVVLASSINPFISISFAEVLNSSDVPGGVVNILTGYRDELLIHFATHMDVNAVVYCGNDKKQIKSIQENASLNVKRVILRKATDWYSDLCQSPYMIMDNQEIKTVWHPIGV